MEAINSIYFPHDYNARNDRKIGALTKKYKAAGYGIFWIACEMMHEEGGHIEYDDITFSAIAKDANEDVDFVKKVINDCITEFKLLKKEEDIVISGRVSRNLEKRQEISKSRSEAGKRGAKAKQMLANAKQTEAKKERKKERNNTENDLGFSFSEDGKSVFFADGSSQLLGQRQLQRMKDSNYQPHYIKKGEIE